MKDASDETGRAGTRVLGSRIATRSSMVRALLTAVIVAATAHLWSAHPAAADVQDLIDSPTDRPSGSGVAEITSARIRAGSSHIKIVMRFKSHLGASNWARVDTDFRTPGAEYAVHHLDGCCPVDKVRIFPTDVDTQVCRGMAEGERRARGRILVMRFPTSCLAGTNGNPKKIRINLRSEVEDYWLEDHPRDYLPSRDGFGPTLHVG